MLGSLGDRLRDYAPDDRELVRIAGMWRGEAELLVVDLVGAQGSERVCVEHDGTLECMVSGPPSLAQSVAELLPERASIRPAVASDAALGFEVPSLGDRGSSFLVGTHADALIGVEWATPRRYQAHTIHTVWACWSQGLVIARVEELHVESDSTSFIAWRPEQSTVMRTTSLTAELDGIAEHLPPMSQRRWTPEAAQDPAAPTRELEQLELPPWPEEGWLS